MREFFVIVLVVGWCCWLEERGFIKKKLSKLKQRERESEDFFFKKFNTHTHTNTDKSLTHIVTHIVHTHCSHTHTLQFFLNFEQFEFFEFQKKKLKERERERERERFFEKY